MKPTVNTIMGILEEAEELGLITINKSNALETWLHDDQGFQYIEEMQGKEE